MQIFHMTNEMEKKQFHHNISVVTIGILILGQNYSLCTAKA